MEESEEDGQSCQESESDGNRAVLCGLEQSRDKEGEGGRFRNVGVGQDG